MTGLLFLIWGCQASAQKQLVIDPNAEMRPIEGSFISIKVSGGISLYLSQSDETAVAVSAAEDKYKDQIKTEVVGGQLRIYYENDKNWSSRNKKLLVYVSFRNLEKLEGSGASDIIIVGTITQPALEIKLSGASDLKGAVNVSILSLVLSGASDISLSGKATGLTIESSGASDLKGYDLITDNCNAKASGASDIRVSVNKELIAHASGASKILYKGDAVVKEAENSGASKISKKEG
jgi:hypothetical protein